MPGSWPQLYHPFLREKSCELTSPNSYRYNCIAWAAGDDQNAWWPSRRPVGYWPPNVPRVATLDAFVDAALGRSLRLDEFVSIKFLAQRAIRKCSVVLIVNMRR